MRYAALIVFLTLAGCNAYQPLPGNSAISLDEERAVARSCLLSTGTFNPFGLVGAAFAYNDANNMDECMRRNGWVRKTTY